MSFVVRRSLGDDGGAISLGTNLVPGKLYTLAFTPTGIGNPLDSSANWYSAATGLPIIVQAVKFGGGFVTESEVDVTFVYNGSGSDTGASIAAALAQANHGPLGVWGYTVLGLSNSAKAPVQSETTIKAPGDQSKIDLREIPKDLGLSSGAFLWMAFGLAALFVIVAEVR